MPCTLPFFALLGACAATRLPLPPSHAPLFSDAPAASDVRASFDCKMRHLALEYANLLQPWRPAEAFSQLRDALDGSPEKPSSCTVTSSPAFGAPGATRFSSPTPPAPVPLRDYAAIYVDAVAGSDANPGTAAAPLKTLPAALALSRTDGVNNQIVLRAGTHFLSAPLALNASDAGLVIQPFPGEEAWVTGAAQLGALAWAPYNVRNATGGGGAANGTWEVVQGVTDVYAGAPPYAVVNSTQPNWASCEAACKANATAGGECTIWTYHDSTVEPQYRLQCWFRMDGVWAPQAEAGHTAGRLVAPPAANVWAASLAGSGLASVPGLRYGGGRLTRARYPNGFPETKGFMPPAVFRTSWTPQSLPRAPTTEIDIATPPRNTSVSMFQGFTAGIGGTCDRFQPNAGYWCSPKVQGGGSVIYYVPTAMQASQATLPHTPYANPAGAVVQTWRPGHWASWMYTVPEGGGVWDGATNSTNFTFDAGGFQGSRGENEGEDTYIENVMEELDAPNEWFYNVSTQMLYVYWNATVGTPPPATGFSVPVAKALFNITGTSQAAPAHDITLTGLGFRDTAYTYMDPHSIPSGGDWTLERSAVVFIENAERIDVSSNVFDRVDGNAVMLSSYVRNASIQYNEFAWIGATAVAAWGDTEGGDARLPPGYGQDGSAGNQPRGNVISHNLCRELGVWEKQSSFYTQFKSSENIIAGNIVFNGPRAHINFNDGFRGGAVLEKNLIFNSCRESGDHGPL